MSFKENLLEKIEIDRRAKNVRNTLGQPGTDRKIDRDAVRDLVGRLDFSRRDERDLELYVREGESEVRDILVLDNDIPLYHTTVADVLLRKSPTTKEMISIKNAVKILSDKDVVVSRREETLERVHKECVATLDLTFGVSDLEAMADEGSASLENGYAEGVQEALTLFAEMLDWAPPPTPFRLPHHRQIGNRTKSSDGAETYGPSVLFGRSRNTLKWVENALSTADKSDAERLQRIADGGTEPDAEGTEVFRKLVERVRMDHPAGFRGD